MPAAEHLRGAAAAVSFLTRVPLGRVVDLREGDLVHGAVLFPIVGAGIGAVVGGISSGLVHVLPALVAAAIALAAGAVLTGGLHLDGLADTADALTAPTRERALEIMRDHATGAYGATALVLDLTVKAAALGALAAHSRALPYAVTAGALGRAAPVVLASALPGARPDGAGASFAGRISPGNAAGAVVVAGAIAFAAAGLHGLEMAGIAMAAVAVLGVFFGRWLGGMTGDTLGATAEVTETLVLAGAAGLTGSR